MVDAEKYLRKVKWMKSMTCEKYGQVFKKGTIYITLVLLNTFMLVPYSCLIFLEELINNCGLSVLLEQKSKSKMAACSIVECFTLI